MENETPKDDQPKSVVPEPEFDSDDTAAAIFDEEPSPGEEDLDHDRIEPLFDKNLKAPWEGAEEQWLASQTGEQLKPAREPGESPEDDCGCAEDEPSAIPEPVPISPALVAPREMTAGQKLTIGALLLFMAGGLGAGAWIIDLRDASGHQTKQIEALSAQLEARQRQIAAIKETSEARVAGLEARLANLANENDPSSRLLMDQIRRNLDIARQDLALADENMTTTEIEHEMETANALRRKYQEEEAFAPLQARPADGEPEPDPELIPKDGDAEKRTDSLDELLAGAVEGTLAPAGVGTDQGEAKAANTLPENQSSGLLAAPSRDQVKAAMDLVQPRAKACAAAGESGRILVKLNVVGATGRVADVQVVDERFKGTAVAACVSREVRQAKFPKFSADSISIKYPFDL